MKRFTLLVFVFSLFVVSPLFAQSASDLELKQTLEESFRNSNEIHARFDDNFYWSETSSIRVEVLNGVVSLRGIVTNFESKSAYIKIAETTPGVTEVVAKIRVIPSARKVD